MNREQLEAMAEATALTRAGRLAEATALIQRTLAGGTPSHVAPDDVAPDVVEGEVVEGEVVEGEVVRREVVQGEIVVDEERRRDGPPAARRSASSTPTGEEQVTAGPTAQGAPEDPPAAGATGSRRGGGGLRDALRERLARAADGVRARLPPGDLRDLLGAPGSAEAPRPPGPALPGTTVQGVHRGAAGARPYTLYVPTTGTGARPLVVMLHGGTQTAADFAAATRMSELAEQHGVLVAYPEQVRSANPMRYWNWFDPDNQGRGGEAAILAGIVDEVARAHEVDSDRVFVAGFSAGAAMAAVLGAAYPDVFVAVGVHSGLPHGCAHDLVSGVAAMRGAARSRPLARPVPVIAFHGDADDTVVVDNAARVVEQFTAGPVRGDTLVERGPGRPATRVVVRRGDAVTGELWTVHGSGHAWSGGVAGGSYTDPAGPDASAEMLRFFADHPRRR